MWCVDQYINTALFSWNSTYNTSKEENIVLRYEKGLIPRKLEFRNSSVNSPSESVNRDFLIQKRSSLSHTPDIIRKTHINKNLYFSILFGAAISINTYLMLKICVVLELAFKYVFIFRLFEFVYKKILNGNLVFEKQVLNIDI